MKRTLLAVSCAIILIFLTLFTVSFFRNRSLEERVAAAANAAVSPVSTGTFASQGDLNTLDQLRAVLDELGTYRKDGPPLLDRFGLYRGDALYPIACRAYSNKFRTLLLAPTQGNMLNKLRAVPAVPTPDSDYGTTYRPLKAYLITATTPDPDSALDTVDFLPAALLTEWAGNATPDANLYRLAQSQFEFYARLLPDASGCLAGSGGTRNDIVVAQARAYLNGFQGFQHVYQSMLAAANHKVPGFNFNGKFPGSSQYIIDSYPVQEAFTKDGFAFMQDAILHPDPYFRGEEWVLGPSTGLRSTASPFPPS